MIEKIKTSLGLCLSVALIFPLALASSHWYFAVFISLVVTTAYFLNFNKNKKISSAIIASTMFGSFFSISFWILSYIDYFIHLRSDLYFIAAFFAFFTLVAITIFFSKDTFLKKVILLLVNSLVIAAFILLLIFVLDREALWFTLALGALIGVFTASIGTYAFIWYMKHSLEVFQGVADYIAILAKPFFVFFLGYLLIALIYSGINNLIYISNTESLLVPNEQLKFLDILLYSLDTMTTGGNSPITPLSTLAQFVNTANVFTAIIWMTIMLAATIAFTSESFSKISALHKQKSEEKSS
ncbi:MAG: hypothetical protein S4CHLAM6_05900 [Chlamydiae bacterium]|nr:hypothetical protein [Chlamydiota bacterium]